MPSKISIAFALIDWHNLEGYPGFPAAKNPRSQLPDAILRLQEQVAKALVARSLPGERFRVTLRLYHGWHRERESMPIRRDFELFATDESMARVGSPRCPSGLASSSATNSYAAR